MRFHSQIGWFAFRTFVWMFPCLAIWYAASAWYSRMPEWIARPFIDVVTDGAVRGIEHDPGIVRFVTRIRVQIDESRMGELVVEVNPLVYTYGAAIAAALMLSSRSGLRQLLLALAALLPFQAWGIAFDFLAQLLRAGPLVASQAGLVGAKAELTALGYQAGSLIFPAVAPVVVWAGMRRDYIARLVGSAPSPSSSEAGASRGKA